MTSTDIQNTFFRSDLSHRLDMPEGVYMKNLADAISGKDEFTEKYLTRIEEFGDHTFRALNTAFMEDGAYLRIAKDVLLEKPLHILWVNTENNGVTIHPRNLFIFEKNTQVVLLESHIGIGDYKYLSNQVTEIIADENAFIEHYKIQQESPSAYHIASQFSMQKRNSNFTSYLLIFGSALARNDVTATLDGAGSEATLNGLYVTKSNEHVDNYTTLRHMQPYSYSRQNYKGILYDKSKAVFNGRIFVDRAAQKTDAIQSNKNPLLSDNATVDTQPQLEIFADDVRCTHGGTVGQLDMEAILYLRSRGISKEDAKRMMTHAFAGEILAHIKETDVRKKANELFLDRLE